MLPEKTQIQPFIFLTFPLLYNLSGLKNHKMNLTLAKSNLPSWNNSCLIWISSELIFFWFTNIDIIKIKFKIESIVIQTKLVTAIESVA